MIFEELYIKTRVKENRLYTDDQVSELPDIERSHPHYREWLIRKHSSERLIQYLNKKQKPLSILDAGCGNGWLTAKLAGIKNSIVTGTDINTTELYQSARVFSHIPNITFVLTDPGDYHPRHLFDIIVFAASIQYFPSLENIIGKSLSILKDNGEIHILDTHFYNDLEINEAKERSRVYYRSLDNEKLSDYYHHHSTVSLRSFNHRYLFNPHSAVNKIFNRGDIFPWIIIKHT